MYNEDRWMMLWVLLISAIGISGWYMYSIAIPEHQLLMQEHASDVSINLLTNEVNTLNQSYQKTQQNLDTCNQVRDNVWANMNIGFWAFAFVCGIILGLSLTYLLVVNKKDEEIKELKEKVKK